MKLIENPKPERVFAVEISETELLDLMSLGHHKANSSNATYGALRDLANEAGLDRSAYTKQRQIIA